MAEGFNQLSVVNPSDTYADVVVADSPLVYWRLGETAGPSAVDASGNSRTGTYAGGVTYSVASLLANATPDTSVTLNGSTGTVTIADAAWMDVTAITLEAWIKTTTKQVIFWSRTVFNLGANVTTGYLQSVLIIGGAAKTFTSSTDVTDGVAHHVVMTYDGAFGRLYVDGVQVLAQAQTGALDAAATAIYLGSDIGVASFVNGTMDEAAIYGRALTAAEVSEHYQSGALLLDHNDIFRYVDSEGIDTAIRIAADLDANPVFNDWEIISGVAYRYFVRAFYSTGGYTDSDPTDATTNTLEGLWITQVTRDSNTSNSALAVNVNAMRANKTPKYQSASYIFKGRSKAMTVYGQNTETVVSYDIVIPNLERAKLDTLETMFAADTTLCVRDVKSNRVFGRWSGIPFRDQHTGDWFSLEFHDEDFQEAR